MISIVIPTLDSSSGLPATLAALVPAAAEGLVREVIVADGGSADATHAIADAMGCSFLRAPAARGAQLAAGAAAAKGSWLLFLHADAVLAEGWIREAQSFIDDVDRRAIERAGAFRFALDSFSPRARWIERAVALRCALLGLAHGEQGLLIQRRFYDSLGGYRPLPALEDVDLARRIGRRRLVVLRSLAVTSPARYERPGAARRALLDMSRLAMVLAGVDPSRIAAR